MWYYRYRRKKSRSSRKPSAGAVTSKIYHSLRVPDSVYVKLKDKFSLMTPDEDAKFLSRYREKYGESAYRYLMQTYRGSRVGNRYVMGSTPSSKTMERILQLVPSVMSTEERFSLFEEIINYNEPDFVTGVVGWGLNRNFSVSYEEWLSGKKREVISAIEEIGNAYISAIDYRRRYHFDDIQWLLDKDISVFCELIEKTRRLKVKTKIDSALNDLELLEEKWKALSIQPSSGNSYRQSEIRYSFELGAHYVTLLIFDANERAKVQRMEKVKEKVQGALSTLGCAAIVVFILVLMCLSKK